MKAASLVVSLFALLSMSLAGAQSPSPGAGDPPPADSTPVAGDELKAMVSGKVYHWEAPGSNSTARLEYQPNGYVFINVSTGMNDSGTWKVEGEKLCSEWRRIPSSCGEARRSGTRLFVKRANGVWATMTPQ